MIPLFDLHCDTILKLYNKNEDFYRNNLHISLEKASLFSPYVQVLAIWSEKTLSNEEAFFKYEKIINYFEEIKRGIDQKSENIPQFILAVEDARILNGDINRLNTLHSNGVRILTLNWSGSSIIGGAWDTSKGLTDFGKEVVENCINIGIIPDISHSSIESCEDIISICQKYGGVPIASHSNSYSVFHHKRNLNDELFTEIVKMKGLVGVCLANEHLSEKISTSSDVLNHIYHFLSLGGENTVCLGCDFDGIENTPKDITNVSNLSSLFKMIEKSFGHEIALKIFFENSFKFFAKRNLIFK